MTLNDIPAFKGLVEEFTTNSDAWRVIYDTPEAHEVPYPEPWNTKLIIFQKLLVLRCIRLDMVVPAIVNFITEAIGGLRAAAF